MLTPVVDGSDSTVTPAGAGYNFAGGGIASFNIVHNDAITNTAGVSFDHNPFPGGAVTLNFLGSSIVSGSIGDYGNTRSINFINLNTANNLNAEILVQAGNILAGTLEIQHDSTLIFQTNGQIAKTNITTNAINTGTVRFLEGGEIIGQTGAALAPLGKLDFLNQSGGKSLTLDNPIYVNNVVIGGDGHLITKDHMTVANQINFTGDGLLTLNAAINGTVTNGIVTQNHQQGNLTFVGNSTFVGNLGQNTKSLNTVTAGATGTEVQISASQIYAKGITLSGDGTLTFNGAGPTHIFAPINPAVNNQGEIKTAATNAVTFGQAVGQTNPIRLFTVSGDAVIDADFKATQTKIANKTLTVNAGKKCESIIDGSGVSIGHLVFNDTNTSYGTIGGTRSLASVTFTGAGGSIFTLQHNIAAAQVNINQQETLLIDNAINHSITGNLLVNNNAQLTVPFGKTLQMLGASANVTFNADTTLNYHMANGVTGLAPALTATGTVAFNATSIVNLVDAPKVAAVPFGQTSVNLIQDASGAVLNIPILTGEGHNLFMTTALSTQAGQLNLVFNRTHMAEITMQPHLIGVSKLFDQIGGQAGVSGQLLTLLNQLDNFTDLNTFRTELASVTPIVDTAINETAQTTQQDVFGLFTQRIEELRAENQTGYNAGYINQKDKGAWVKLFVNHSEQDPKDFINGFNSTTTGFALGGDLMLTDRCLIGLGFAYANSMINHDLNEAKTDINYYQASVYGGVNMTNPWFMNWMAAATYLDYHQKRTIKFSGLTLPVRADYPGWQYGARAELGYAFGKLSFHTLPTLALTYSHLDIKSYTETGAGTANQTVSHSAQNHLQAELGVKFVNNFVLGNMLMQPEAHLKARYEILDDKQQINSQFISIGPAYDTVGYTPTRESYNAGTSLTLFGEGGLAFSVSYDYDFKNDYCSHTGFVRLRYEW